MSEKSTTDQILDLLLDALQERQAAREAETGGTEKEEAHTSTVSKEPLSAVAQPIETAVVEEWVATFTEPENDVTAEEREETAVSAPMPTEPIATPDQNEPLPSIHLEKLLGRMVIGVAMLILLINIPFNIHGTALARAMPDEAALVIRNGLLLKGSGDKVYVLENNELRWITSLALFESEGYHWDNVHEVEDRFIAQFEQGNPVYEAYKCATSPHVYVLENGEKRWVKDVPTFTGLGLVWEEVRIMPCSTLRETPDGLPIPPDAGEPPQP